ncbi:MAG: inositol monophosphatase family protein [Rhodospirillaceae bacterium]|jgi:myo-inositol-1(or 4)-monophosphatase|nr:inositol monophosphatase family protein [Rhodospirillaceae bacterium]
MAVRSPILNVMVGAAEKASRTLKRDFGEVENLQVSRKGTNDFVTAADTRTEKTLQYELAKARPAFGFIMEESGVVEGEDKNRTWIIDPIDGTTNFIHGIPHFAISIALMEYGELVAGLVYNPVFDEMFLAEKGQGATCNNRRLRVSSRIELSESVLATGIPHYGRGDHPSFLTQLTAAMSQTAGVRRFGSAALDLAYVAAGRFDGFWETGLKSWDIAAGILLVKEAGGFITEIDGKGDCLNGGSVLASNPRLHKPLSNLLTGKKTERLRAR